ncbi:MAG: hypothetical protein QNK05_22570, partial [Myxococcota bacterium]|nr:hypothetical protein [Myxococcota bacterium]
MRSFNYLATRFAHGDDFVCDAPDAVASSVELLLAELPPPRVSVDSGAVALDEGLGTLVFVRRSRPTRAQPASPLGARR